MTIVLPGTFSVHVGFDTHAGASEELVGDELELMLLDCVLLWETVEDSVEEVPG
jgi:hypothetical protein